MPACLRKLTGQVPAPPLHNQSDHSSHHTHTAEDNEEGDEQPRHGKDPELADALAGGRALAGIVRLRLRGERRTACGCVWDWTAKMHAEEHTCPVPYQAGGSAC